MDASVDTPLFCVKGRSRECIYDRQEMCSLFKVKQNQLSASDSGWQENLLQLPQQLRLQFYTVFKCVLVFEESLFVCVSDSREAIEGLSLHCLFTEPKLSSCGLKAL